MRKHNFPNWTIPVIIVIAILSAIIATVGCTWLGWDDIAKNRRTIAALPVPPSTERTSLSSYGYSNDDSWISPPHGWGTLAEFEYQDHTRAYLHDYYVSQLSAEWKHCTRELVPGFHFTKGDYLVSLDTSNAPPRTGAGSFEIHVSRDVKYRCAE